MRSSSGFNGPASTGIFSLSRSLSLFPKTQSREGNSQGVKKSTTKKIKDINCLSVPTDIPKTNCKVAKMADSISSTNNASINNPTVFEPTKKVSQTGRVKNTPKMFNKMQVKDDNGPMFKNAGKILKDEAKYDITYERAEDAGAIKGVKAMPSSARLSAGGGRPGNNRADADAVDEDDVDLDDDEMQSLYEDSARRFGRSAAGPSSSSSPGDKLAEAFKNVNVPPSEKTLHIMRQRVQQQRPKDPPNLREMKALALAHGAKDDVISGQWHKQRLTQFLVKHNIQYVKEE